MTSQIDPIAMPACPGERNGDPWWQLCALWEHKSFFLELGFNLHGSVLLLVFVGSCQLVSKEPQSVFP